MPGALGSCRRQLLGLAWESGSPSPQAWVPSWGLQTELSGPHRLLGSLWLANGAGDAWGA